MAARSYEVARCFVRQRTHFARSSTTCATCARTQRDSLRLTPSAGSVTSPVE